MSQFNSSIEISNNILFDIISQAQNSKTNLIHILLVNFGNTTNFTKQIIGDLLVQDADFDLTIIDNYSDKLKTNLEFYKLLQKNWNSSKRTLHILGLKSSIPLNHLWNYFFESVTNEWLCFLNNDICIPENFISDNIKVISKEKNVGIINHATNNLNFKTSTSLNYKIYDKHCNTFLHRQGWDFTIKRDLYTKIPKEFTTFVGDNIQFYGVYAKKKNVIFLYSSPILHYCSKSRQKEKENFRKILQNEKALFYSDAKYQIYGNTNQYDFDHSLSYMHPIDINVLKRNIYGINKKIIVSMTTWKKRIINIPIVLKSILNQSHKPDKIIINLSKDEFENLNSIPKQIKYFIEKHNIIEINFIDGNTKVYKKIIPTLLKYKNDLILSIDDDFIYPETMIEDFYQTYKLQPNQPISGNRIEKYKLACHCGCASLVQYKFFAPFIDNYLEYYQHCPSSDLFYTIIANKNGYTYTRTKNMYFNNMKAIQNCTDTKYSKNSKEIIESTYEWLSKNIFN